MAAPIFGFDPAERARFRVKWVVIEVNEVVPGPMDAAGAPT